MTYEQLIQLQDWARLIFLLCIAAGAIHLLLGLVRPIWVKRAGRGGVVLVTLGIWLAGLAVFAGAIGYTHSHPNGPHALKGYLDEYFAEQCAQGADLPACKRDGVASEPAATAAPQPAP